MLLLLSGGFMRLLEEFDVIPAYLSKREMKTAFALVLAAQVGRYVGGWVDR